jgi:hypothetical protein
MRRHRGGLTAHDNRAEPRYSRPGAPIHPEQPRGTKATTTRLTIAGNRKFESTSLQRRVLCEPPWSLAEVFRGDVVAVASCVEEIDAALESSLDERAALRLVDAPGMIPPIGDAIAHAAEADPRHLQTRATKLYIFHCRSPGVSTHRRIGF